MFTATQPGYIRMLKNGDPFPPNLLLYSTIPIIDSHNNHPALVNFTPAMNYSIGQVQFMDCTLTLCPKTVVMDAQTQKVLSVEPDIRKTTSAWSSYTGPILSPGFSDLDWAPDPSTQRWPTWLSWMPDSTVLFTPWGSNKDPNNHFASFADMYLYGVASRSENALSILVASMFWTLAHVPPTAKDYEFQVDDKGIEFDTPWTPPIPPVLLRGIATATQTFTQGRLDSSVIAIAGGLAASIFLFLLALPSLFIPKGGNETDILIDGTGILHAIWMFRNHPELETLLPQVEHPTNENLRAAGLVRTRLVGSGPGLRKRTLSNPN
ncbi:hypothetical protein B0H14DRAFT_3461692 [Mycena olivaceomarginata]|nr:hypothetical protein B0H14DRAFT_3461692 [Mycena olivaceomarginata]